MCLLAVHYRIVPGAPVAVAANREERFDRPASPPALEAGPPRFVCATDRQAGGTWMGVNEHGLLVAVTNRPRSTLPPAPRSRGLLCRDLLACATADEAARRAFAALGTGRYAGANFLCADAAACLAVHGGDRHEVLDLPRGLHVVTNGDFDDRDDPRLGVVRALLDTHAPRGVGDFVESARRVCADPRIVVRRAGRGTVCSQIVALTADPGAAVFLHAPGPPDRHDYEDCSETLRAMRGAGRAVRPG